MRAPFRDGEPAVAELAAGGIVRRRSDGRLLLLHETSEERWCFPKGHVEPGESLRVAALREVEEETGLRGLEAGREIGEVHYRFYQSRRDRNVLKTVVYFEIGPVEEGAEPRLEAGFDRYRWATVDEAEVAVPYEADRAVLAMLRTPSSTAGTPRRPANG